MEVQYGIHIYKKTKIENIQRRAARFVKINYIWNASVTSLINDLNWQSLQSRRATLKVTMMYK